MPKNLLLADDSVTIQKVVGITFAGEDIKITAVDNGEDAIARARELRPDIVLADVVMPRKNGYELCEAIKADAALSKVPVLLLAGTFEAFDEARARSVRADAHIAKPFESQALINKVKELLGVTAAAPAGADAGQSAPGTAAHATVPGTAGMVPGTVPGTAGLPRAVPGTQPRPGVVGPAAPPVRSSGLSAAPPPARPHSSQPSTRAPMARPGEVRASNPVPGTRQGIPPRPAAPSVGFGSGFASGIPGMPSRAGVRPGFSPPLVPGAMPPAGRQVQPQRVKEHLATAAGSPRAPNPAQPSPRPTPASSLGQGVVTRSSEPRPVAEQTVVDWGDVDLSDAPSAHITAEPGTTRAPQHQPPPSGNGPELIPGEEPAIELTDLDAEEELELVSPDAVPVPVFLEPLPAGTSGGPSAASASAASGAAATGIASPTSAPTVPRPAKPGTAVAAVPAPSSTALASSGVDCGEAALREALSLASREVIERIAWEIVPTLAETIIREHIDRLVKERQR